MPEREAQDALQAFIAYTQSFQTLDPRAPGRHFHQPALTATPHGVRLLANESDVARAYEAVMAAARAASYARTEFFDLKARRLSEQLAVVSGGGTWRRTDGAEIQRFGLTYTLCLVAGSWRILTALVHDPT